MPPQNMRHSVRQVLAKLEVAMGMQQYAIFVPDPVHPCDVAETKRLPYGSCPHCTQS